MESTCESKVRVKPVALKLGKSRVLKKRRPKQLRKSELRNPFHRAHEMAVKNEGESSVLIRT